MKDYGNYTLIVEKKYSEDGQSGTFDNGETYYCQEFSKVEWNVYDETDKVDD